MSTGLINIGVTGIQVAQLGLLTTSHNITNADTAGYNRQRTVQASNIAMLTGSGFIGQGANVTTIERMYDRFLNSQVNTVQTSVSELGTYDTQISQIDNMLADANSGMSTALQSFFAGVQDMATNPSQTSSRQALISSAQSLVARFQGLDTQLSQMYESVNGQITSTVSSINSYSKEIGNLNAQIIVAQSAAGSQPANDLLDQRDQLVSELNKLIKVTTSTNSDGSFNVFVGTGQQLVVGTQVTQMTAGLASNDPTRIVVGLKTGSGTQELPEALINGGSLGGLVNFRSESLDSATNQLGREAASLALTFNAQNALGQDLLGRVAGDTGFQADFFSISAPTVIGSTSNNKAAAASVTAALTIPTSTSNFTNLTSADYQLDFDGAKYTLTRSTDGHQWSALAAAGVSAMSDTSGSNFTATEGFSVTESVAMVSGDSFKIEPVRAAAKNLSINPAIAADPRLIAAAAPIRTAATSTNTGNGAISAGSVDTGYTALVAGDALTLTYDSATKTLSWPATTSGSIGAGSVAYTSGSTITIAGINVAISGTPNTGDTFAISRNSAGTTDGRNGLLLGKLQTQNTMLGGKASYQVAYAQLVSQIGNKTREVQTTGTAQQALLDQTTASMKSLSGVNLDEEAANLLKYQQAYQASSKVVEMGSKLFDTLLAIN